MKESFHNILPKNGDSGSALAAGNLEQAMNTQINAVSGKEITGKNLEAVMINRSRFGWESDRWATYNQIKQAGGKLDSIRAKGKSVRCVSYPKGEAPIWFSLFNLDLVDGWPEPKAPAKPKRGPGRPKGSKNKASAEGRTITLTEEQLSSMITDAINQTLDGIRLARKSHCQPS